MTHRQTPLHYKQREEQRREQGRQRQSGGAYGASYCRLFCGVGSAITVLAVGFSLWLGDLRKGRWLPVLGMPAHCSLDGWTVLQQRSIIPRFACRSITALSRKCCSETLLLWDQKSCFIRNSITGCPSRVGCNILALLL